MEQVPARFWHTVQYLVLTKNYNMKKKQIFEIQFRKFKGEMLAVFPYEIFSETQVTCYAHIGQHSGCMWEINSYSKGAKPHEYKDLLNELKQIYNDCELKIINRRSHDKYLKAYYKSRKKYSNETA